MFNSNKKQSLSELSLWRCFQFLLVFMFFCFVPFLFSNSVTLLESKRILHVVVSVFRPSYRIVSYCMVVWIITHISLPKDFIFVGLCEMFILMRELTRAHVLKKNIAPFRFQSRSYLLDHHSAHILGFFFLFEGYMTDESGFCIGFNSLTRPKVKSCRKFKIKPQISNIIV